jgi:hypothetical protein
MVDFLVSSSTRAKGATVMPFFNPADYSSLVLIKAAKDHLIDRQTWYEGSLFSQLKQGGYGKYRVINITRIEERLS